MRTSQRVLLCYFVGGVAKFSSSRELEICSLSLPFPLFFLFLRLYPPSPSSLCFRLLAGYQSGQRV